MLYHEIYGFAPRYDLILLNGDTYKRFIINHMIEPTDPTIPETYESQEITD